MPNLLIGLNRSKLTLKLHFICIKAISIVNGIVADASSFVFTHSLLFFAILMEVVLITSVFLVENPHLFSQTKHYYLVSD